jgi:hypothetical protein
MAGDLRVTERATLERVARGAEPALDWPGRVIHQYGRLKILTIPEEAEGAAARSLEAD